MCAYELIAFKREATFTEYFAHPSPCVSTSSVVTIIASRKSYCSSEHFHSIDAFLLEVIEHEPALLDPAHNAGEVVVEQHKVGALDRVRVSWIH